MIATAAGLEINPGGKKVSTGASERAVLVLSSPPEVFNAEIDRFVGGPDKISGNVVGVIKGSRINCIIQSTIQPNQPPASTLCLLTSACRVIALQGDDGSSDFWHPWPRPKSLLIRKIGHYWDLLQGTVKIRHIALSEA